MLTSFQRGQWKGETVTFQWRNLKNTALAMCLRSTWAVASHVSLIRRYENSTSLLWSASSNSVTSGSSQGRKVRQIPTEGYSSKHLASIPRNRPGHRSQGKSEKLPSCEKPNGTWWINARGILDGTQDLKPSQNKQKILGKYWGNMNKLWIFEF